MKQWLATLRRADGATTKQRVQGATEEDARRFVAEHAKPGWELIRIKPA